MVVRPSLPLARDAAANYLVWVISRGVEGDSAVRAKGALHTHSSHADVTLTEKVNPRQFNARRIFRSDMTVLTVSAAAVVTPVSPEEQKSLQQIAKGGFA